MCFALGPVVRILFQPPDEHVFFLIVVVITVCNFEYKATGQTLGVGLRRNRNLWPHPGKAFA
jgi:hypothetical protein